ncbi:GNAT family N-acetyltransferase [Marinibactrum halimedae]|uniref:N-acetyltransferase domain-containing protein n=1 Tax=Marinibactrum halimedae TaxID=1444977 RepID=A0AA37WN36_9GAMM|nr:GNAT family N-acetyltransferase [Marinibactrum halimedae]MCD9460475.1 GNAT family N-acetyltransferase [Marinibactrum halimedae]GLS25881.1 hypothetical protein GCM10007877_15950 [Marinibactrum halimedae]
MIEIITAKPKHIPILLSFWEALSSHLPESVFPSNQAAQKERLQSLAEHVTSSSASVALLAISSVRNKRKGEQTKVGSRNLDEAVIGCIAGHIHDRPEFDTSPLGILYNLWVSAEFRRQGVGRTLVLALENQLREKGAKALQVAWRHSERENISSEAAAAFWQRLGYLHYESIAGKV